MSNPTIRASIEPEPSRRHDEGGGSDGREQEKGGVNRVPPEDAPRIVPERGGVDESDLREHDLATHPDKIDGNPDDAGDRPRPL